MIRSENNGFVIASLIITTTFMALIGTIIAQTVVANYRFAQEEVYRKNAQFAADAGIDAGISELNLDNDWSGTVGEIDLATFTGEDLRLAYQVDVTDVDDDSKIINVTGRSYWPASSTTPKNERKYSVDLRGLGDTGGVFSIVTGVGGLEMDNSAKIVDGDVYVNGVIDMANTAQIGTATNSVDVKVAYNNCPVGGGAGYPAPCTTGQPVTMNNSAKIFGRVCGNRQTSGSGIDTASPNGLYTVGVDLSVCGSDNPLPALPLPPHDRDTQKTNVSTTLGSGYTCDSNTEKVTWPANYKIVGNVEIKKKCEITLSGDVWITGNLKISNSAKFIVANTLDANIVDGTYPTVMVDGSGGIEFSNSSQAVANSSGTGAQFITYWSDATCSPNCASVTGQDLYDSSRVETIKIANLAQLPSSILYAKWSEVDMNNGGDIGALVGQTIHLRNSAAVTFGASLSGGGGSSSQVWLVENYRRTFN